MLQYRFTQKESNLSAISAKLHIQPGSPFRFVSYHDAMKHLTATEDLSYSLQDVCHIINVVEDLLSVVVLKMFTVVVLLVRGLELLPAL